ncbi:hypothetical protein [Streptomyces cahuitamycinicus]|uniref:hypothetical protein n=1 Tax=Streptomyces cahuitamycinicus TaxID=2070367 RepID=UPI0011AF114A|nr:hypothetical protein [Streptomyces cahuitamycinicus]
MDHNNFQPFKDLDNAAVERLAEGRNHLYEDESQSERAGPIRAHVAGNTLDEIGPGCAVNCATAE